MNDLLRITKLSKHYDGFDLRDINLNVPAGCVVGFIGSNGAGKTTTIKAALGLVFPDSGNIDLLGTPLENASSAAFVAAKQRIGVVFDTCAFPEDITVKRGAAIMAHAYNTWDNALFSHYLSAFNLPLDKKIKSLSRGMGMKLTLACALAHTPDLLILDEATAGLDPLAREEVLDILRDFMDDANHGILMSTHITSDLEKIADYVVCIDNGRIVFSVEKDTITDTAGIARCRTADFETLANSGFFAPGSLRFLQHEYGIDVLIEDRFAASERFKTITLDKASIEDYMTLMLKGGTR
ncbi:MAG: ABC transporter ATP-binding protein [Raoultibacter sp.]